MKNLNIHTILFAALTLALIGCRSDDDELNLDETIKIENPSRPDADSYSRYLRGMFGVSREFTLEFAHETGAEPYSTNSDWEFTRSNIKAVFDRRSLNTSLRVPWGTRSFAPEGKTGFSLNDIVQLAERHRTHEPTILEPSVFVMVLNGFLEDNGELKENVVGVNINNTSIVAVFKPTIEQLSTSDETKRKVEQNVIVHEVGHAFGLVRKGIPLASNHHDTENEHHCTNRECVMYHTYEIAGKMKSFAVQNLFPLDKIVFDDACLNDIEQFRKN